MISDKLKIIFVHIPKCCGTTIENLYWPHGKGPSQLYGDFVDKYHNKYQTGGLQHLTAPLIKEAVGPKFDKYFKFAFVRNPWDRTISQYLYIKKRKDLMSFIGMKPKFTLEQYLKLIKKKEHVQWMPQHKFVCDENGEFIVDAVGDCSQFKSDIRAMMALWPPMLKNHNKFPKANQNSKRNPDYKVYYTDATREMVADFYAKDISLFQFAY